MKSKLHGGIGRLRGRRSSFINWRIVVFEGSTVQQLMIVS